MVREADSDGTRGKRGRRPGNGMTRWEALAHCIAFGMPGKLAYEVVGLSQRSNKRAHEVLNTPRIKSLMPELKEKWALHMADNAKLVNQPSVDEKRFLNGDMDEAETIKYLKRRTLNISKRAMKDNDFTAALKATETLAKLSGVIKPNPPGRPGQTRSTPNGGNPRADDKSQAQATRPDPESPATDYRVGNSESTRRTDQSAHTGLGDQTDADDGFDEADRLLMGYEGED